MFEFEFNKKHIICIGICFLGIILSVLLVTCTVNYVNSKNSSKIVIDSVDWENFVSKKFPTTYIMTKEEYEVFCTTMGGSVSFDTYEDYVSTVSANYVESNLLSADGANLQLYEICDKYFQCYYGNVRISPILPMAIANVETPGRADFSKTWSALFPSRYVDTSEMLTFDVTDVVSSEYLYSVFSNDYSTRDRGPLQMSPTYGTGSKELNALMSGTEKEKLSNVDTTAYATWVSGASSYSGDRFYLPDMLLRLSCATNEQIKHMVKNNYLPKNDMHLVTMLCTSHNVGNPWYFSDHSKKRGCWRSGELLYEFTAKVSTDEFVAVLQEYADTHDATYIDSKTAKQLYLKVYDDDLMDYVTKEYVSMYPVKALYSYIKLTDLYTD